MKKWLSGCLAVAMLITTAASLSACKNQGGGGTEDENDPYKKYSSEVTYTTVRAAAADPKLPDGMDLNNNPYVDFMKEYLNVKCEILWEDSMYDDKLLLDVTSGTIPDVFMVNDYATYQQLYASDMLADLTDVYEKYASDEMKDIYNSYADESGRNRILEPVTEGGRLMALPSTANGYQQALLWVRKDWLDALGLQPPKTIDEIADVARKFVEQDPGGNGPGNTIGLNAYREHAFQGYRNSYGLEPLAGAMGAFPRQWMQNEDGQVYYGTIQPEFKQVLSKVREWFDAGIMDQKCFDQNWETVWANVDNGKAGMWFFPWSWPTTAFKQNNPRAEVICYPAPLDDNGQATFFTGCPFEGILCVRKGYEHPEVVFKVYNLYTDMTDDTLHEGYEALAPTRDAGTAWYYLAPLGSYACRYDDVIPRNTAKLKKWIEDGTEPTPFTDSTKESWNKVKSWIENEDDDANWVEYMGRYVASGVVDSPECNPVNPVFFFQTKTMIDKWDYLETIENDMIRTIMSGEESIDAFDAFVEDWKTNGGDEITAEVQQYLAER